MFCHQCEQTARGTGTVGSLRENPEVAALQDLLIHALKGLSFMPWREKMWPYGCEGQSFYL